jgi:small subunit ribosomal protein S6
LPFSASVSRASQEGGLASALAVGTRSRAIHRSRRTSAGEAPPSASEEDPWLSTNTSVSRGRTSRRNRPKRSTHQLQAIIEEGGGSVAKIEYWGLRNLTYRIKKNRKGHYSLLASTRPGRPSRRWSAS